MKLAEVAFACYVYSRFRAGSFSLENRKSQSTVRVEKWDTVHYHKEQRP